MCGIFGKFAWQGPIGSVEELCASTNSLSHRGPDDGAFWADDTFFLGHRRLSIIDLSPLGAQPMATVDGRFVVVFNGEIYNYKELVRELESRGARFRSESDTEVLLHGYREWGVDLPKHLVGMFAFAIADRAKRTLFVARDRFGEKPLFLAETRASVTFASELRALARLPESSREIDEEALHGFLCRNYVPGESCLLKGVQRLEPGCHRLYETGGITRGRYWTPPAEDTGTPPRMKDAAEELGNRLDRSVRIALRADVPIALFLSGGIDSSAVAESAARQGVLRHAYCLDFPESGFSELPNASLVARKLGLELRRVVLSSNDLVDFSTLVDHADDPLGDASALPVFTLSRAVAKDYKVVISGDGGDELFGGYLTYKATHFHTTFISRLPMSVRARLAWLSTHIPAGDGKVTFGYKLLRFLRAADLPPSEVHFTWNGSWLPRDARNFLVNEPAISSATAARPRLPDAPELGHLQRADIADYLPNDILTKVDRMTMAHGLEARAPLLIPEVAEFGLTLPAALKLGTLGPPKRVLRHLVTERLGPEIGHAKKQGFSIPIHPWLRGPLRPALENLLSKESIEATGFLDPQSVLREKQRHLSGEAQLGFELWGLMVLVEWHRLRIRDARARRYSTELRRISLPDVGSLDVASVR